MSDPASIESLTLTRAVVAGTYNIPFTGSFQTSIPLQPGVYNVNLARIGDAPAEAKAAQATTLPAFDPRHANIFTVAALGINWGQILVWMETYGIPMLLQALAILLSGYSLDGVSVPVIVAWISAALVALASGQPIPPFPALAAKGA
jgi:hypothetical protein